MSITKLIHNQNADRLELIDERYPDYKPIYVDFMQGKLAYRRRHHGISLREPLARAIGIKPTLLPSVMDITAGLGQDAFIIATLGCDVTLIERSPIIAALLADGLKRAGREIKLASIMARLHFQQADSFDYLSRITEHTKPDVIYCDPMYPPTAKSALVKKTMRLLRETVGHDHDAAQLFTLALRCAKNKVVVKRHRYAASITALKPTHAIYTKIVRFDVYILQS